MRGQEPLAIEVAKLKESNQVSSGAPSPYAVSGTDIAHGVCTARHPVDMCHVIHGTDVAYGGIGPRVCHAVPGTDIAYARAMPGDNAGCAIHLRKGAICLRPQYEMPGTDTAYGVLADYGTEIALSAYARATRCPYLTQQPPEQQWAPVSPYAYAPMPCRYCSRSMLLCHARYWHRHRSRPSYAMPDTACNVIDKTRLPSDVLRRVGGRQEANGDEVKRLKYAAGIAREEAEVPRP
eukprot:361269-Rhodomonas_salina.2